ncbi:hypothetical protein C5167_050454 [Papaver somniferum]|uniref:Uncharacterized protein n=1 Tax=Papaver somniferum TaxID=3469 RepID=A0A4Y7KNQ2_PAPSO|nr:hypothetical protein C5167_050454 [Papaver somniferum]
MIQSSNCFLELKLQKTPNPKLQLKPKTQVQFATTGKKRKTAEKTMDSRNYTNQSADKLK